jgi:hypothetical protein
MTNSLQNDDKQSNDLTSLTEQNWLFINNFLQNGSIKKSYQLAGYRGKDLSAPYQLFKQLKSRIEDLANLDVTSRARLQADLARVLDLPLAESKKELTLSEWLRVRKFVASITPDVQANKPQISVLIINRSSKDNGFGDADGNNLASHAPQKDVVIDAELIDPQQSKP